MVSARGPYADNWEQFFKKIRAYSPKQRKTLLEEAQIDPKLAMIHGLARLRATVTAAHDPSEIERAMDVIGEAGKKLGIIK